MKFKMQDKLNQLIERIPIRHLIVGIDIAQQFHVARAVNFRGIVIGDPLTFENNEDGFARLIQWINRLKILKGFMKYFKFLLKNIDKLLAGFIE